MTYKPEVKIGKVEIRESDPSLIASNENRYYYRSDLGEYRTITKFGTFATPSSNPKGLGMDSQGFFWHADADALKIYKLRGGSIIASFATPSSSPVGVDLDSNDCIWHCDESGTAYKLDQTGSIITSWATDGDSGVGVDPNGCIWFANNGGDTIEQYDQAGSLVSNFDTPNYIPTGVGIDPNGCIWNPNQGPVFKFDQSGAQIASFSSPCSSGQGLQVTPAGCIWLVDGNKIWLLDQKCNHGLRPITL